MKSPDPAYVGSGFCVVSYVLKIISYASTYSFQMFPELQAGVGVYSYP